MDALIRLEEPTVFVLTDTRLKSDSHARFDGYTLIRHDTDNPHAGGVAIGVRHGTRYQLIDPIANPDEHNSILTILVRLETTYKLTAYYRRPRGLLARLRLALNETSQVPDDSHASRYAHIQT